MKLVCGLFLLAISVAVVPKGLTAIENRTAEGLAKEFKNSPGKSLRRYLGPDQLKPDGMGLTMVIVTGIVEKIDGNRVFLKTETEGIDLVLLVSKPPKGIAAGDTVKMKQGAHVKGFKDKTVVIECGEIDKVVTKKKP